MKILILTGGDSSEREISLLSAKMVKKVLKENNHAVRFYDLRRGYEPLKKFAKKFDVLFPVLHGEEGEGGILHKFLSKLNKPIVGTRNYKGMSEAWHKIFFKKYCDENNIKTSPWKIVRGKQDILEFGFPSVFKTSSGGSSKEVFILRSEKDLNDLPTNLLNQEAFVEEYLPGVEVTVGILNGKALPIIEIIPPKGEFFSYENKYTPRTQEIPFAPSLNRKVQKEIQDIALRIHKHFNLGSYSRIDFIVSDGVPYVLEVNTIPGLTPGSLLPKQAKAAGISFNEFIEELLKTAS
ncbi:MAG: hypothetical protein A2965_00575 [Candidatus Levybacteria bacterium RIFCSPLOWO2_01_FULL_40_96]|nr:MAG: D-alanine-D-alanine ligase [Candidatus Levybacteria bacterium GW2011_GWA1_39_34]OGH41267.1 MAG: hypothetical protein A2965_00575 [Candidatus Levybacteria bacterium RIFCSPLOWO2_01_FULL_40_96]